MIEGGWALGAPHHQDCERFDYRSLITDLACVLDEHRRHLA